MNILYYTLEEYMDLVRNFHGFAGPGVTIGGFMVDLACQHVSMKESIAAICETSKCLPDSIQLLTPCTTGNGKLIVIALGRFAMTLYDRFSGQGVRVFMDAAKVEQWPEIKSWYFKLKPKKEQNQQLLMEEIGKAGAGICSTQRVLVARRFLGVKHRTGFTICPQCKEAYPSTDGYMCLGCQDKDLYEITNLPENIEYAVANREDGLCDQNYVVDRSEQKVLFIKRKEG